MFEEEKNGKNIIFAVVLSLVVIIGWPILFPQPEMKKQQISSNVNNPNNTVDIKNNATTPITLKNNQNVKQSHADAVASDVAKIKIESNHISGTISLVGGVFNNAVLNQYNKELNGEEKILLLSHQNTYYPYFFYTGWVGSKNIDFPTKNTLWKADKKVLSENSPVTLSWTNNQGVTFKKIISIADKYIFNVKNVIENNSIDTFKVSNYGSIIRKGLKANVQSMFILHEGGLSHDGEILREIDYSDLDDEPVMYKAKQSWSGFVDKYWFVGFMPSQNTQEINYSYKKIDGFGGAYQNDVYNDFDIIEKGTTKSFDFNIFVGAKEVDLLDKYEEKYNAKMFDSTVDWGWFYFITKPFYYALSMINEFVGNVGWSIIILTVLIKIAIYPLANKSYFSMAKMKHIAPKVDELRKKYKDDKQKLGMETMKLYQKEGVNPLSGCLPVIVQIPIFFSLYKVLFVTLAMRQAPFIGWIEDLSAADPNTILTLFGFMPWDVPSFLAIINIGIWPILMGLSMHFQQKLNPKPTDPIQEKVFFWMPIVFTFVLATFPAGLVIYWTVNNVLSIAQQYKINRSIEKKLG